MFPVFSELSVLLELFVYGVPIGLLCGFLCWGVRKVISIIKLVTMNGGISND